MSRTPTHQQQACIDALLSNVPMLKISACAGSGKTSTLEMCAKAKEVPSLYLAFNKVTAEDGAKRFPRHVTCKTTHSVAYAAYGAKLRNKLSRPAGRYVNVAGTGLEISRYYHLNSFESSNGKVPAGLMGMVVRDTVARFEQSADSEITLDHVPSSALAEKLKSDKADVAYLRDVAFRAAKKLWADRIDLGSPVLATHDTYLKLYQLSKPILGNFDVVYVDEFQDTTPCVMDIIMNQKGRMQIVMVGDARQAIYGWRGAVNAMELVRCPQKMLTQSFRYGQKVADVATAVLLRDMVITGNANIASEVGGWEIVDRTKPHTRLFRTNSALLAAAIEQIGNGVQVAIEIDVKDFCKMLQSAEALFNSDMKNVKHDKMLPYAEWVEAVQDAENDPELKRLVKVVTDGNAQRWIELLENFKNSPTPLVTFTTAHKSKGREFEQVVVEDDFKSALNDEGEFKGLSTEEENLLYVALTRAILKLEYNSTTSQYLTHSRRSEIEAELIHDEFKREVMAVLNEDERLWD